MTEQTVGRPAQKTAAKFEDRKDELLAKLAVKHQCVNLEQLHEALSHQREQKNRGAPVPLEEVFIAKGLISQKQLATLSLARTFLIRRDSEQVLSKLAVRNGLVSQEQVDGAMERQVELFKQTKSFKPLTDILAASGLLPRGQRAALLAAVARADLNEHSVTKPDGNDQILQTRDRQEPDAREGNTTGPSLANRRTGGTACESNLTITVSDDGLAA